MNVFVATKNAGKLAELQEIFAAHGWELATYAAYRDPVEGDRSYAENAALKARALREQLAEAGERACVLGDDSGLEVTALGGRPGIRSARYGPADATWAERRTLLLAEVARSETISRAARFVCALHVITPDGREFAAEASCPGTIAERDAGTGGFSYDAIFRPLGAEATFAEISAERKNAESHRAKAARLVVERVAVATGKSSRE